ncbi:MAG TPA: nitrite reductase small subunit NirD [Bryobacteraceae bacterium]|nr:nitrite reductase small subunit NirD [Bryobacteraceae bacterium]
MNWIRVTPAENIPLREGRSIRIGEDEIAIFNLGGRYVAVDNACPHRGGPLCDSIVSGDAVICPLHGWKISLDTGAVLKPEVCVKVETYPVSVKDGVIRVQIPTSKRGKAA